MFMNLAVLALSLALVYLGASGLLRIDPADNQTGAERPFVFICVVGALLAVSSLAGVAGAMCAISRDGGFRGACCSNRLLLFYYLTILVECALLLYAAILCFVFVNKAAEYLAEYGDSILALAANEGLTLVASSPPPEFLKLLPARSLHLGRQARQACGVGISLIFLFILFINEAASPPPEIATLSQKRDF